MSEVEIERWERLPGWPRVQQGLTWLFRAAAISLALVILTLLVNLFFFAEAGGALRVRIGPLVEIGVLGLAAAGAMRASTISPGMGARRWFKTGAATLAGAVVVKMVLYAIMLGQSLDSALMSMLFDIVWKLVALVGDVCAEAGLVLVLAGVVAMSRRMGAAALGVTAITTTVIVAAVATLHVISALIAFSTHDLLTALVGRGLLGVVVSVAVHVLVMRTLIGARTHVLAGVIEA